MEWTEAAVNKDITHRADEYRQLSLNYWLSCRQHWRIDY